jgi:AcrR family transcriptional regulator
MYVSEQHVRFLYTGLVLECQQPKHAESFNTEHRASFYSGTRSLKLKKITPDRRIQRTRQLLQDALVALILEKGYEATTVQDVIDRANVGRSTFYAHFQDKEDLFLSGFEHLRSQFEEHLLGQSITETSPWELSLVMFQHAQGYQRVYKALIGERSGPIVLAQIQKYLLTLIGEHLRPQLPAGKKGVIPLEILTLYVVSSLTTLLTWWLDHDMPYPAEEINNMFRQLTQPALEAMLVPAH